MVQSPTNSFYHYSTHPLEVVPRSVGGEEESP